MKDSKDTLQLISGASRKIIEYTHGGSFESFSRDSKTQSAVIMQLVIIGELSKKLDQSITAKIDLPWKLMAGFRDFAVHEYFELDLEKVWDTITNDIPEVTHRISEFLSSTKST